MKFNKINIFNFNGEIVYSKKHEYTQEKNLILQNIKKGNIYYSDN